MCPINRPATRRTELFWTPGYKRAGYLGASGAHDGDDLRLLYDLAVAEWANYRRGVEIGITDQDDNHNHDLLQEIRTLRLEMIDTAVMQALADITGRPPSHVSPEQMCRYWLEIGVGQTAHYLIGWRWRILFNTDEDHTHAR